MSRQPLTAVAELADINDDDLIAGYRAGRAGDDEPGHNHSTGYWHGWRNGAADRTGNLDQAQRQLAHAYVAAQRANNHV